MTIEPNPSPSGALCPWCRQSIDAEAQACPFCRRSTLVDVCVTEPLEDTRQRYQTARFVLAMPPEERGAPLTLRAVQAALAVSGGVVAPAVTLGRAAEVIALLSEHGVGAKTVAAPSPVERTVSAALQPGSTFRRRAKKGLVFGISAFALLLAVGLPLRSRLFGRPSLSRQQLAKLGTASTLAVRCAHSVGAGFLVEPDLMITNAHVLCNDGEPVRVSFADGRHGQGTTEKRDDRLDLALVRLSGVSGKPLKLGDAGALKVGEPVTMIGSPVGMAFTVHRATVSNLGRPLLGLAYVQIEARVNPGNSGGPILNDRGEVVGIVSLKVADADGIGLALPINYAFASDASFVHTNVSRSAGFAEMVVKAEAEEQEDLREVSSDVPHVIKAVRRSTGGGITVEALLIWARDFEPMDRAFNFRVGMSNGQKCDVVGNVLEWKRVSTQVLMAELSVQQRAWLEKHNLLTSAFAGVVWVGRQEVAETPQFPTGDYCFPLPGYSLALMLGEEESSTAVIE